MANRVLFPYTIGCGVLFLAAQSNNYHGYFSTKYIHSNYLT